MNGKVYVLEDDAAISGLVRVALEMAEIDCTVFSNIKNFMDGIGGNKPDVVLLDVMLPDGSGLDVLEHIKREYPEVSCLIMSALGQESDKIRGLEKGADDYISKPFSVAELTARVKAALRRQLGGIFKSGALELNADNMQIKLSGEPLALNRKEYELLRYFITHEGKVLSREKLLDKVWGYGNAETRTLDNHIARLRKLGVENIETVFGVGYRLKAGGDEA